MGWEKKILGALRAGSGECVAPVAVSGAETGSAVRSSDGERLWVGKNTYFIILHFYLSTSRELSELRANNVML